MTDDQWNTLNQRIKSGKKDATAVAFIIDSPWLPGFYGIRTMEYFASGQLWFQANRKAIETFPQIIFLPGFWSEFGMCTEPSAFGAKCTWRQSDLPHAGKTINDISGIKNIFTPDPRKEGLLPFVIERLLEFHEPIRKMGHRIRFAVSRGPLNIASFLMGSTEFLMATAMNPEETHQLLRIITDFTVDWLQYQKELFTDIDGIFILDDIVGFVGDEECREFAVPYLKEIFHAFDASIRFFHNDAPGLVSSKYLREIGVNLFNFSHEHSFAEILELTGNGVTLLGNLPPRDILATGSTLEVEQGVTQMMGSVRDDNRIIWSCGGGVPPDVPGENIKTFYDTVVTLSATHFFD